ncbi:MAG: hypothetical protein Q9219_006220 [cf. Caloplaca sp. 3 TL-2023]
MASDVEEFIENHGLKSPALIGHSMGAKVAMTVALKNPNLLGALIPVDNAPVDACLTSNFRNYLQGMQEVQEAKVKKQVEADEILGKYEDVLPIRQFLMTNLVKDSQSGYLSFRIPITTLASSLANMGDFPFKDSDEACYKGPTLFVRGTKSHYVADDVFPAIGQFFPKFTIRDIDCGHWIISEQPEAFRQAVVSFFRGLEEV